MDHNAKRQHHEQARKKHKHDREEHARELARKKPSWKAMWILIIGLTLMAAIVVIALVL